MTTLREKMKEEMILMGLAPSTQAIYLKAVIRLNDYYQKSPAKLSRQEIRTYLLYLKNEKQIKSNTYNTQIYGLRFFYYTTLRQPLYKLDLKTTKVTYKLPDILSPDEVQQIIKAVSNIKYRTLLIVIYGAGLRISEALNLKIKDIDSKRKTLHIRCGKGNKGRYVILSPTVDNALRQYWKACRFTDYIFPSPRNPQQPLNAGSVSQRYKTAKSSVGITKEGGVHALRHAFATHLLESGTDIFAIKALLGHASIQSTVRYLAFVPNRYENLCSPIEKLTL